MGPDRPLGNFIWTSSKLLLLVRNCQRIIIQPLVPNQVQEFSASDSDDLDSDDVQDAALSSGCNNATASSDEPTCLQELEGTRVEMAINHVKFDSSNTNKLLPTTTANAAWQLLDAAADANMDMPAQFVTPIDNASGLYGVAPTLAFIEKPEMPVPATVSTPGHNDRALLTGASVADLEASASTDAPYVYAALATVTPRPLDLFWLQGGDRRLADMDAVLSHETIVYHPLRLSGGMRGTAWWPACPALAGCYGDRVNDDGGAEVAADTARSLTASQGHSGTSTVQATQVGGVQGSRDVNSS